MKRGLKKGLTVLITAILVISAVVCGMIYSDNFKAEAAKTYSEGYYTYTLENSVASVYVAKITDCATSASGKITIPSTLGGYNVKFIGAEAFSDCSKITSVIIPNSVTSIGDAAFLKCTGLTSITIPESVRHIGTYAFSWCTNLEDITIPNSVTEIAYGAFNRCEKIKSITIPSGIESIENTLFSNCISLTSVTIPDSVTSIGSSAFSGCTSLANISIPDSVTSIDYSAFYSCTGIKEITMPVSATFSEDSFQYCTGIEKVILTKGTGIMMDYSSLSCQYTPWYFSRNSVKKIVIEYGVTHIGSYAFCSCSKLTSVTIPDSVTSIGDAAFSGCTSLTSITIPNSVTSIGNSAFSGCTSLANITIPDKVTSLGNYAFCNCTSLTSIVVDNANPVYSSDENGVLFNKYKTQLIQYPLGNTRTSYRIPDNTTSIVSYAFQYCDSLESVAIPDIVTSIGSWAFRGCTGLKELIMPVSAKFHNTSFADCTGIEFVILTKGTTGIMQNFDYSDSSTNQNLYYQYTPWYISKNSIKEIVIADGVINIGDCAFYDCTNLESITISDSVTSIGSQAFCNCTNLTSVTIPDSVTIIEREVFYGCTKLISITVSDANTAYSSDEYGVLFNKNKTQLIKYPIGNTQTSYVIPDSVKSISTNAFRDCKRLTSTTISDKVTSIDSGAFYGCTGLKEITMPASAEIESTSFTDCTEIEKVTLTKGTGIMYDYLISPKSYTYTPWYTSRNSIKTIIIEEGTTNIGDNTFYYCTGLKNIIIPNSITSIGSSAFSGCTSLANISIPDSVTSIGDSAFYGCTSLANVTIPASVTSIGTGAFFGCSGITSITVDSANPAYSSDKYGVFFNKSKTELIQYPAGNTRTNYVIPDGVASVGYCAFGNCLNLTSITIPGSITSVNSSLLSGCTSLKIVVIEDGVEYIYNKAFSDYENLEKIVIPVSVKEIRKDIISKRENIIYYCGTPEQWANITIPDISFSVFNYIWVAYECLSDEPYYFRGVCGDNLSWKFRTDYSLVIYGTGEMYDYKLNNNSLYAYKTTAPWNAVEDYVQSIEIGNKVESIGDYAFYHFDKLTKVELGDRIKTIGKSAFMYGGKIKIITIPDEVLSIGYQAFYGCVNLETVNYNATNCTYVGFSISSQKYYSVFDNCWSLKTINIGKNVKSIPNYIFCGVSGVTSITIPENVTSIGSYAFHRTELKSVVIPDSVTTLDGSVFKDCTSLETAVIGNGVLSLNGSVFEGCTALKSVTLPQNLRTIGGSSFKNCAKLTCVNIPASVNYIYDSAFSDCMSLTSITIPENVTYIGESAFYNCIGLTTVNYNAANCKTMGSSAKVVFENCSNLRTINIGKTVKSIPDYAFAWYLPVDSIAIPDSVTNIGSYAFAFCENFKNAIIPDSVTTIGAYAFGYCYGMEYIHIPSSVTAIGENVLKNTEAYICSDTLDCYAKTYSAENGIAFMLCDSHEGSHFHSYTASQTAVATCTTPGVTVNTCSCGDRYQEGVPALGHKAGEWQTVTEATEETEGKKIKACTTCGETVDEKILPVILIKTAVDNKFGIALEYNANSFNGAVAILVSKTENQAVTSLVEEVAGSSEMQVHSIAMTVDGVVTQPEEAVTLRIPLPENFDAEKSSVYSINPETGKVEEIAAEYENGYFVFEATEMNYYAVVEKSSGGTGDDNGNEGDDNGNTGDNPGGSEGGEDVEVEAPIKNPTTTTISYGDSIVLHIDPSKIPEGGYVEWYPSNGNFGYSVSSDGTTCTITPNKKGDTTFTATVYDAEGNIISADEQVMTSKAGFFDKIIAFFKKLFGLTKTIPQIYKGIY